MRPRSAPAWDSVQWALPTPPDPVSPRADLVSPAVREDRDCNNRDQDELEIWAMSSEEGALLSGHAFREGGGAREARGWGRARQGASPWKICDHSSAEADPITDGHSIPWDFGGRSKDYGSMCMWCSSCYDAWGHRWSRYYSHKQRWPRISCRQRHQWRRPFKGSRWHHMGNACAKYRQQHYTYTQYKQQGYKRQEKSYRYQQHYKHAQRDFHYYNRQGYEIQQQHFEAYKRKVEDAMDQRQYQKPQAHKSTSASSGAIP